MFDGQSYNYASWPETYPKQTMQGLDTPFAVVGISGLSWTTLSGTAPYRLAPIPKPYKNAILVMAGGQSDLSDTHDNDAAAKALADMEDYANTARGYGFDKVVILTVNKMGMLESADEMAQTDALNAGIRASSAFDYVADVAVDPRLADWNDTSIYVDTIHWTPLGNQYAAETVRPKIQEALASLT